MINELMESENHYYILSDLLLNKVADEHPAALQETKAFVARLEDFNVYEKTMYVAELLEALEDKEASERAKKIERVLKDNNITPGVISLLQQYNTWIK